MEQSGPCHSPQQLGSHVEGSSEKGDVAAHQAGHSHSRVDVSPTDVAQSLDQGPDTQAEGHGNLQHGGQGLWPVEGRTEAEEDEEERGQELCKHSPGEGYGPEFPHAVGWPRSCGGRRFVEHGLSRSLSLSLSQGLWGGWARGLYRLLPSWIGTREVEVESGPLPCLSYGYPYPPPLPTRMPITPSWPSQLTNVPH